MSDTHFIKGFRAALLLSLLFLVSAIQAQQGDVINIRQGSPDNYVVVEGDTLWDIAGVFLDEPWLWPEIWQLNPQISNPDLIYPGDNVVLYYVDGQPRITVERGAGSNAGRSDEIADTSLPVIALSPRVRCEPLLSPIPAISLEAMSPYLSRNRVIDITALDNAPTVLGSRSDRKFSRENDVIFALGSWAEDINTYEIVRPTREINDPLTGDVIAVEAELVGSASILDIEDDAATLVVNSNLQEVRIGDSFVVSESLILSSQYFPVAPEFDVTAAVMDINFGRSFGGKYDTLIINLGAEDNIEAGHLLALQKANIEFPDPNAQTFLRLPDPNSTISFSGEIYGRILVYRVFDNHSFALVLSSDQPVALSDRVITP